MRLWERRKKKRSNVGALPNESIAELTNCERLRGFLHDVRESVVIVRLFEEHLFKCVSLILVPRLSVP